MWATDLEDSICQDNSHAEQILWCKLINEIRSWLETNHINLTQQLILIKFLKFLVLEGERENAYGLKF